MSARSQWRLILHLWHRLRGHPLRWSRGWSPVLFVVWVTTCFRVKSLVQWPQRKDLIWPLNWNCVCAFYCLVPRDRTRYCIRSTRCSVTGRGRKHAKLLHTGSVEWYSTTATQVDEIDVGQVTADYASVAQIEGNDVLHVTDYNAPRSSVVYLPLVKVKANRQCDTYALLDTGSTGTFISERLASRLQLDGAQVSYKMNTLSRSSQVSSRVVDIDVAGPKGESAQLKKVMVLKSISARLPGVMIDVNQCP